MRALKLLIILSLLCSSSSFAQKSDGVVEVLIRCDDAGMTHAVNDAMDKIAGSGLPVSISVMVPCPWFQEAVEMLHRHPGVAVGLHLTLNAEWRGMRWGPVLGAAAVPSLVDSLGYFFPSRASLAAHGPKLDEIERELRAQIDRALKAGLKPVYVDYHMGAAVETPERRAIVEKLAAEYGLAISRYFGEEGAEGVYRAAPEHKTDTLVAIVNRLRPGPINLLVFHVGQETPEMDALIDLNTIGLADMSKHRNGEFRALMAPEFRQSIAKKGVRMVTYTDLVRKFGLGAMRRPAE